MRGGVGCPRGGQMGVPVGGVPAVSPQALAALGLPPGGGRRALGGLLRLYREAAAGGARRERELRGLRQRLEHLQVSGGGWPSGGPCHLGGPCAILGGACHLRGLCVP